MANNLNEVAVVRINIDGCWTADDMSRSFQALDELYNLLVYARADLPRRFGRKHWKLLFEEFELHPLMFRELGIMFPVGDTRIHGDLLAHVSLVIRDIRESESHVLPSTLPAFEVRRVRYGSEGFKDLAGAGDIVGHIKDFVLRIIEMFISRKQRAALIEKAQLENDERRKRLEQLDVEIEIQKVEAATRYVQLMRDVGFTKSQIKSAIQSVGNRGDLIGSLVERGQITSVTTPNSNEATDD